MANRILLGCGHSRGDQSISVLIMRNGSLLSFEEPIEVLSCLNEDLFEFLARDQVVLEVAAEAYPNNFQRVLVKLTPTA